MSALAAAALQTALYERLTGDAELMASLTGVFDHVPAKTALPYAVIGPATAVDWSTKSFSGQRHSLTVSVYSDRPGALEAKTLADRVHALLVASPPLPAGHKLVAYDFDFFQSLRTPDGIRQAVLRYAALTHPL